MTPPAMATKRLALHVHDHAGQVYEILLDVDEHTAKGMLRVTAHDGAGMLFHTLAQMQKSHDGKTLTCKAGAATATLTLEDGTTSPALHLVARIVVPVLEATYTLSAVDQQRLVVWMKALTVATFC